MGELELEHVIISKMAMSAKAATTTKATMAAGALKSSLIAGPIGWPIMIAAAVVALILMDKATTSAIKAVSKA